MLLKGYLRMLKHRDISPVQYFFVLVSYTNDSSQKQLSDTSTETSEYELTDFLGKKFTITFQEAIRCLHCAVLIKKSYNQGYCYKCFISLAKNDLCILKPETCHHHKGTCREPEWGLRNCFRKHKVYLANTSGIKVGITKEEPITNRWVDQGAVQALAILETNSRLDAGIMENEIRKYITDKTSWQKMVSTEPETIDLKQYKQELLAKLSEENKSKSIVLEEEVVTSISYPIRNYPFKKISYKLKKNEPIEDILVGIKGQYLLLKKVF